MFHQYMPSNLRFRGRQQPSKALKFWQDSNNNSTVISPVNFNNVAKVCLSSQASSPSFERLFGDLRRHEGAHQQSTPSSTLQMRATISHFVQSELRSNKLPQNSLLHPTASFFKIISIKQNCTFTITFNLLISFYIFPDYFMLNNILLINI